jgi:hypothetical protein
MADFTRDIESALQTTRVTPGLLVSKAELNVRIEGTLPPAHGDTEQSGFGLGQYDGRSTWADAGEATKAESVPKRRPITAAETAVLRDGATKRM